MYSGQYTQSNEKVLAVIQNKVADVFKDHPTWTSIISTRVLLALLAIGFLKASNSITDSVLLIIAAYLSVNAALFIIPEGTLRLRRMRLVPDVLDALLISTLVLQGASLNSPWVGFYFFPIISAARYWGKTGSLMIVTIPVTTYVGSLLIIRTSPIAILWYCLAFLGIAIIAGHLARARQLSEVKLIEVLGDINVAIFSKTDLKDLYKVILDQAVKITNSDSGHIRKIKDGTFLSIVVRKVDPDESEEQSIALTGYYSRKVLENKRPIIISKFSKRNLRKYFADYYDEMRLPKSALFVPLFSQRREIIAVLAVYTRRAAHYSRIDISRLENFAPLLEIAETQFQHLLEESASLDRYLNAAINKLTHPIIAIDSKGVIRAFNSGCEQIWKMSADEAIGENITDFYETRDEAKRVKRLLTSSPSGQINIKATIRDKSGIPIPIKLSATLIKNEEGIELGSLGVFKDLSDVGELLEEKIQEIGRLGKFKDSEEIEKLALRILEAERLEAFAAVGGFISHDVKNKLDAAKMEVATLRMQIDNNSDSVSDTIGRLDDAMATALSQLTRLALVRSSKSISSTRELVYVENIFEDYFDYLERLAKRREIELKVNNYPKTAISLSADKAQLRMVLDNLFDNSVYAIMESKRKSCGKIEIEVTFDDGHAYLNWNDNGIGIPKAMIPRIFSEQITTKEFGIGLGLFWTKSIIENHKGDIKVLSSTHKGTSFQIRFPRVLG